LLHNKPDGDRLTSFIHQLYSEIQQLKELRVTDRKDLRDAVDQFKQWREQDRRAHALAMEEMKIVNEQVRRQDRREYEAAIDAAKKTCKMDVQELMQDCALLKHNAEVLQQHVNNAVEQLHSRIDNQNAMLAEQDVSIYARSIW
jgi:DNA repair exonuclease SbcCD nuclease subunit